MFILLMFFILFSIFMFLFNLYLLNKYESKTYNFDNDLSRTQKRLFEKQLSKFDYTFSQFSNYQLSIIIDRIKKIIESRS